MNFLQLEYFLAICQYQNISKAAAALYISQPALSQQLLRLEQELDVKLFNRHGGFLSLTSAGEHFRESAQRILFEYRNTRSAIENLKETGSESGQGHLTIGVTKTKSFITLSYLLSGFRQKYPEISIDITEVDSYGVEELIRNGSVDLGFCYGQTEPAIHYEHIYEEKILLAVPPLACLEYTLPKEDGKGLYPSIQFHAFRDQPFILGKKGYLRDFTLELFEHHHYPLTVATETTNPGLVHLLVAANVGCAFVGSLSTCIKPLYIPNPVYCVLEPPCYQNVCLGYHKHKYHTKPMRCFIDYAKQALHALPV